MGIRVCCNSSVCLRSQSGLPFLQIHPAEESICVPEGHRVVFSRLEWSRYLDVSLRDSVMNRNFSCVTDEMHFIVAEWANRDERKD